MSKRVEFKVFTNLTKEELDLQRSLETQPRFGYNGGEASDSLFTQSENEKVSDNLKTLEETEIAEFRMRSFNKIINKPSSISTVNELNPSIGNTKAVSKPIINVKLKKRLISTDDSKTVKVPSSSDSATDIDKQFKTRKLSENATSALLTISEIKLNQTKNSDKPINNKIESKDNSIPSALPLYYSDDDENDT